LEYSLEAVGTTVYYRLRWLGPRDGQEGPWSEIIIAIIN
jgi:hypothetical protein